MAEEKRNPCTYKRVCKSCTFTRESERPKACKDLKCDYFTPCKICKRNLVLNNKKLCDGCEKAEAEEVIPLGELTDDEIKKLTEDAFGAEGELSDEKIISDVIGDIPSQSVMNIDIGLPGECPKEYNEACQRYYKYQWDQYTGFFRDPTLMPLLHTLIILEMELNWVIAYQIKTRGEAAAALDKKRESLIKNITDIRKQLPTDDAGKLSDQELSLSNLYNMYVKKRGENMNGRLKRVLSPETYALAPVLHYPVNARDLLTRLGYQIADADRIQDLVDQVPKSPDEFAKFMGYPIDTEGVVDEVSGDISDIFDIDDDDEYAIDYKEIANG